MLRRYATADVFTDRPLSGNPVAVVLDADGLSDSLTQALANEFNYVETTFVSPPEDSAHTARVRIFTPDREVPFAGHPTIGTAFLLARQLASDGRELPERFVFEQAAGLVEVDLITEGSSVVGAGLLTPQPLSRRSEVDPVRAAACLGLDAADVSTEGHLPQVVSVGLPFLVVELASRAALRRARPDRRAYDELFPLDDAKAVYAYVRADESDDVDLHSRMFTFRLVEDPATGSATAAVTALLADLRGDDVRLAVRQGEDMGRPSMLRAQSVRDAEAVRARVGGRCEAVFSGTFDVG